MFLLLFALFAADLGGVGATSSATPDSTNPISKYVTWKSFKDISAATKALASYIPHEEWRTMVSAVLEAPSAIDSSLDAQNRARIDEIIIQIGFDIGSALLTTAHICDGLQMEEISIKAAALLSLIHQAEFGMWLGNTIFVEIFLKSYKQTENLLHLNKIPAILALKPNPLTTAIEADDLHRYTTIDQERMRIVRTSNTMAFAELKKMQYANDSDVDRRGDALYEILQSIRLRMNQIIDEYAGETYYFKKKVPQMIQTTSVEYKDDKAKAKALMKVLTAIHTRIGETYPSLWEANYFCRKFASRDRFIVVVYSKKCGVGTIFNALESNCIHEPDLRTIVYRSRNAFNITEHKENGDLNVIKWRSEKKPFSCSEIGAFNISKATTHSGLVLVKACPMEIEQDETLGLQKHSLKCLDMWGNHIPFDKPMNFFLIAGILISSVHSFKRVPKPPIKDAYPSSEFYRLTKILNRNDFHTSDLDFRFEIARKNYSEGSYSETCTDAFVAMKFMPKEMNDVRAELSNAAWFLHLNNITDNFYEQFEEVAPRIHWFLSSRRETVEKLSVKALPDTQKFIKEAQTIIMNGAIGLLRYDQAVIDRKINVEYSIKLPNEFLISIVSLLTEAQPAVEKTFKVALKEIALKYRNLPAEIKIDLDRSFCIRNALNWINSDMNGVFDKLFNSFNDEVGLNLQELLKDNEYLSNLPPDQVKDKFKKRAEKINLTAQEYVNNCAKMFSSMKLNEEEMDNFNKSTEHFMGKEWGRKQYTSVDEMLQVLVDENAPFMKIITKRRPFIVSYPMTPFFQHMMTYEDERIVKDLMEENNRQARVGVKRKISSSFLVERRWFNARQFEQFFCLQSTLESIVEREIDLKD